MDSDQERIYGMVEAAFEANFEGCRNKQADVGSTGKEHNESENGGSIG